MTLPRLLAAMAIRALSASTAERLDPIVSAIVGAVSFAAWERLEGAERLLGVPDVVSEAGARLSGVVAGCGCETNASMFCVGGDLDPHPLCECGCHDAIEKLVMAKSWADDAREALARPKPEAADIDDDDDALDYGVTAPGGCS